MNCLLIKFLKKTILVFLSILVYNTSIAQVPTTVTKQSDAATKAAADAQKQLVEDAEKIKKSLAFKVADFFKFKSNVRKNQKKRTLELIETLGIQDSINVSAGNIKFLIDALSKVENQHFDTLLSLINGLKLKPEGAAIITDSPDNPVNSSNKPVSDSEIDELTNKMLPLVAKEGAQPVDVKAKNEKVAELKKVLEQIGTIHEIKDSTKGITKRYTLITSNKVKVLGFFNYNSEPGPDYNYDNFDNVIYNGLFVDGNTGNFKNLNGWDNSTTLSSLSQSGVNPILNVIFSNKEDFSSLLLNKTNQELFFKNTLYVMDLHNTNGVSLQIDQPDPLLKNELSEFIQAFSSKIKAADKLYLVYLILPNAKVNAPFDLAKFDEFVDYYILNFYNPTDLKIPGPIATIKGKDLSSIESTFSYYSNMNVQPGKFILGLGYQGTRWSYSASSRSFKFSQQLTYSEIRKNYLWPVIYDDEKGTVTMDSVNKKGLLERRIYFEDENSLAKKYDFVLENALGGVALYSVGFDEGYGELNDMLFYKFGKIDTISLENSSTTKADLRKISFFKSVALKYSLYAYILNEPCEICFENIKDDEKLRSSLDLAIQLLGYDTIARKRRTTTFVVANESLNKNVFGLLIILLFIAALLSYLLFLRTKNNEATDRGRYHKILPASVIFSWYWVFVLLLIVLFTSDSVPWFGQSIQTEETVSSKDSTNNPKKKTSIASLYQKASAEKRKTQSAINKAKNLPRSAQRILTRRLLYGSKSSPTKQDDTEQILTSEDSLNIQSDELCKVNPASKCINMPFKTLWIIITFGMWIGGILGWVIIKNLLNKVDVP
jgi:spore germination protein YaaH